MSAPESRWLIVVGSVSAIALIASLTSIAFNIRQPARPPQIVTADFIGIVREQTLGLAQQNLSEDQLAAASRKWSFDFKTQLEEIVVENNIIIMPSGIGVFGTPDITPQLRDILGVTP